METLYSESDTFLFGIIQLRILFILHPFTKGGVDDGAVVRVGVKVEPLSPYMRAFGRQVDMYPFF